MPAVDVVPEMRVADSVFVDVEAVKDPVSPVHDIDVDDTPAREYPAGKIMTIFPVAGSGFAVVNVTVAVDVAFVSVVSGSTFVFVSVPEDIVSALTVASVEIVVPDESSVEMA